MKKLYFSLFTILGLSFGMKAQAQCSGERYYNFVFPNAPIVTSNVAYGENTKFEGNNQILKLDVYEPNGDTASLRPLVIFAHGGSFVGGSKTGTDVVPFCKDLAKLGYVTASIEYRLGMNGLPLPGPDSSDATEAVMRGVHDGRAAVRFFRKNADTGGNTYRIDPNNIFFGGSSAGGFIALQMAYLDQPSEIPTYIDTVGQQGLTGGIEGNSGNPGYSSEVRAIINMCGAIGDTSWINAGDEPVINFHGTNDDVVPFGTDIITLLGFFPLLKVDGSNSVNARVNHLGITNCFEIHEGQGHTPATGNAAYYDTSLVKIRNFLYHFVCGDALNCNYNGSVVNAAGTGIQDNSAISQQWSIFPNPASNYLTIDLNNVASNQTQVNIINALGQTVVSIENKIHKQLQVDMNDLPKGIYFVQLINGAEVSNKKLIVE